MIALKKVKTPLEVFPKMISKIDNNQTGDRKMNAKKVSIVLLLTMLCCSLVVPSARAGNVQRNRWEGVAIGLGAAILGNVLMNHHRYSHPSQTAVYHHRRPKAHRAYRPPRPPRHGGYWEMRKIWVPPTYKRVWNPAHYNRRDKWIPGGWIKIEDQPGYWEEKRVWVSRRY